MTTRHDAALRRPDDVVAAPAEAPFELTLFVSGASDVSARAIANARKLCDLHLEDRYRLSVVDVREDPAAVSANRVIAAPTLIKHRPHPERRFVGDLSHTDKVLVGLELLPLPTNALTALS